MAYERVMDVSQIRVGDIITVMGLVKDDGSYTLTSGEVSHTAHKKPYIFILKFPVVTVLDIDGTIIKRDGTQAHVSIDYGKDPFVLTFRIPTIEKVKFDEAT